MIPLCQPFLPASLLRVAPLVLASLVLGRTALAAAPVSERASALFADGVEALLSKQPGSTQLAFECFRDAYADSPNWKILGNLGVAAHRLERYGDAKNALEGYLREGAVELTTEESEQVSRDLNIINFEGAQLKLEVSGGTPLLVHDERVERGVAPVINDYGPFDSMNSTVTLLLRAGQHRLRLQREGFEPYGVTFSLQGGEELTKHIELTPAAAQSGDELFNASSSGDEEVQDPQWRGLTYSLWATGGLALGGAIAAFVQQDRVQSEENARFDRECPDGVILGNPQCGNTNPGDRNAATWKTVGYVGLGVAAAGLIGGTTLYFLDGTTPMEEPPDSASRLSVRGWISPFGVGLNGRF